MGYPEKLIVDPFIGEYYREMTPQEYDDQIQRYRDYAKKHKDVSARRMRDYVDYLNRWFGDGPCDGLPNFKARHTLHTLPMPANVYMYE